MSWVDDVQGLAGLSPAALRLLAPLNPINANKGTVLFQPGGSVIGYVIVLEGNVGVYLMGPTGRELLLYRVEPGGSCIQSTLGLLTGDQYSGEAVCETDCRAIIIPRETFLALLDQSPEFRAMVFSACAARMQSMMHTLEDVTFQKVECRLANYLLREADPQHVVHATQTEIARSIGSVREVVSRRLESFARKGLISQERGRINLLKREWLAQIAAQTIM
jgi:CRP/FNR family transcriptional regulator